MRAALVLASATMGLAFCAESASAAFDSCAYNAATKTVTATFGTGTVGALHRSAGGTIEADGGPCGAATVTNTDLIAVVGDADAETLNLQLDGGPFAPGATDEIFASDEIELDVQLGGGSGNVANLLGSPGVDTITAGIIGGPADFGVNLNADETLGDQDRDMVIDASGVTLVVDGAGGNDVLSDSGGPGATVPATSGVRLIGGPGNDDVTVSSAAVAGPGNDKYTFPSTSGSGALTYAAAPGPVTMTLTGTAGGATSTGGDGFGDTDTYVGELGPLTLSPFDDHATALSNAHFNLPDAGAGNDTLTGGSRTDLLYGRGGNDTIHGGGGADILVGYEGDDQLMGDAGTDQLQGDGGFDTMDGGEGDDVITETVVANIGPDDIHGGPGTDFVQYSSYRCTSGLPGQLVSNRASVTVDLDDVADDGAAGEGDNVHSDIEDLYGTGGDDTLTGDADANLLNGLSGSDTLRGGGGDDRLEGLRVPCAYSNVTTVIGDAADDLDGGPGADTINASLGDDVIEARDGATDTINCGPGTDAAAVDAQDVLTDCEGVDISAPPVVPAAPGDPVPAAPAAPAAPAPAAVAVFTAPVPVAALTTPKLPSIASLIERPAASRCVSRRQLRLRVKRAVVSQVKSVTISVNGKRKTRLTGKKVGLPVDLRGLPKGKFTVRLDIVLADGRTVKDTRTYRTCAARKR
jgi:Ca2+-binding RTX toxin-like protein